MTNLCFLINFFGKALGKSIDYPVSQQMRSKTARELAAKIQLDDRSGAPDL
jgi:hypothetical protein